MEDEWCSLEEIYEAYKDCKRRKSRSKHFDKFSANLYKNLYQLWKDLNDMTYEIGYSDAFCVTRPKVREVFAAWFGDRVVHHFLIGRLLKYFEGVFIDDTYNCRVGRGVDYGVRRVAGFMEEFPNGWILKCDIKCFFMNIDKQLLADKLNEFIDQYYQGDDIEQIKWLTTKIVMHRPELKCVKKGDLRLWDVLPKGKSLFDTNGDKGLAIGNLTSQIFANYYLYPLDSWLNSIPNIRYGRYVDDFVVIAQDKETLLNLIPQIRALLNEKCKLELHPEKIYLQPVSHGVNFLGSTIKQGRIYAGNRTVGNATNLVWDYEQIRDKEEHIEKFAQRYNSYMGYLIHRKTYGIRWDLWENIDEETKQYVYLEGSLAVMRVRNEYKEEIKLKQQYKHGKKRVRKGNLHGDKQNVQKKRGTVLPIAR